MANHPNRATELGIIKTTDGRTGRSYAVLERINYGDFRYATYLRHYDIATETRVAYHRDRAEAERRYGALEVQALS